MRFFLYLLTISCISFSACVPDTKPVSTKVDLDINDKRYQGIKNLEYNAKVDSLKLLLGDQDPTARYLACKAFASIQDASALDSLYSLLDDPNLNVRAIAAYAIGQTGQEDSENALINAFRSKDTMSVNNPANAGIIEAIGKLGRKRTANLLMSARGYRETDTLLWRAKLRNIYYYTLRGMHDEEMSNYALDALENTDLDQKSRLYAAHSLARVRNLNIEKSKFRISKLMVGEQDKHIKMALALALRHSSDSEIQKILLRELATESDDRVRINMIRALGSYSYIESAEIVTQLIEDDNLQVAITACEFIAENGIREDAPYYLQIVNKNIPWQVKSSLLKAVNKLLPYTYTNSLYLTRRKIQELVQAESDSIAIASYLRALSHDPASYEWLIQYDKTKKSRLISTAVAETLSSILTDENFRNTYRSSASFHRGKILEHLLVYFKGNNEGAIAEAANAIADEKSGLAAMIEDENMLLQAKGRLDNPGAIESIHAIDKALAQIRGNEPTLTEIKSASIPDWSLLESYNKQTKAIIKTSKGSFTVEFFIEECPSTVLNFLKLASENYYDNKIFHRVVPNFVIQTGSPRSDNYGGADYVIRSEFAQRYYDDEALLGMASAGKHTESTQWFVTHSPTPHLDGKYTLFGRVTEGKEVISRINQGDMIEDIIITNL